MSFNASTCRPAGLRLGTLSTSTPPSVAGIGHASREPLHGGANEAAMELIPALPISRDGGADGPAGGCLLKRRRSWIRGTPVYRERDPRNAIIKDWSGGSRSSRGDTPCSNEVLRCCRRLPAGLQTHPALATIRAHRSQAGLCLLSRPAADFISCGRRRSKTLLSRHSPRVSSKRQLAPSRVGCWRAPSLFYI